MRYVDVGGAHLSVIGLGTWQFGSREWGYGTEYAEHTAVDIVHRALDLGINLIDTAEIYAFGRSERIVGRAIAGRRDEAFVATKVFPVAPLAPVVQQRAVASADRLGIDTIDLYQVHWPNPLVPIRWTMAGVASLLRTGVVRHAGVSNFSLAQWKEAERSLGGPVLSNQVSFSLAQRGPDRELVPWAQENGRLVIAYSPLAQGLLSARFDSKTPPPGGVRAGNPLFLPENLERAQPLLDALREVAVAHGATPAQIALAWLIRKPNVVAIPGASSVAQLEANAAAADIDLSDDEHRRLTEASDAFSPIGGPRAAVQLAKARVRRA
ncbi:MAG TPA: aldo/keto reductase [Acidimicrobiales bacterium]|nr:aldo/keto reductase [Acidimicrobiales bacterium]